MAKRPAPPVLAPRPKAGGGKWTWRSAAAVALLTLAAAGLGGWWYVAPRLRASSELRSALAALDADDFPAARSSLLRCRELRPDDPEVCFVLARLERRGGDPRKAQELLQEAGRLGWSPEKVAFERALLQVQAGKVTQFAGPMRAAFQGDRADAILAYEAVVRGWLQLQDVGAAHLDCKAWVDRFGDDWRAHYWWGLILEAEGYHALAAQAYQTALDANPGNSRVRQRLAETLVNLSEFPRALPHLEACRAANPTDPDVRFSLARCLQALGRDGEAEELLQELVREYPRRGPALLLLARVRLDREDPAGAAEFARRDVALEPFNPLAAAALAEALRGQHADKEAAVWEEKARTLTEQNERLAALTRTVKSRPADVEARYELGILLRDLGRGAEAVQCWRGGLAIDPNHKPTREALAALSGAAPDGRAGRP
jgi:tetratricopeptide (TPR) repeat protein